MRRAGLVAILTTVAMVLVALPALRVEWGGVDVSALSTSQRQRRRPGPAEEEQRQRGEQGEGEELGRAQVDVRLVAHLPPHHGPASEGHAGVAGEARVEPSDDAVLPGTRLQGGEERHAAAVPGDGGAPGDDRDPGIAAQRAGHAGGGSPARSGAGAAGGADERDDARLRLPPGGALDAPDRALARGPGHLERPRVREQSGHGAAEPGGDEEEDEGPRTRRGWATAWSASARSTGTVCPYRPLRRGLGRVRLPLVPRPPRVSRRGGRVPDARGPRASPRRA